MFKYSEYNDPLFYRNVEEEEIFNMPLIPMNYFKTEKNEEVFLVRCGRMKSKPPEEMDGTLDDMDRAIICMIALTKYVIPYQVYTYLKMKGCDITRNNLNRRLLKLAQKGILYVRDVRAAGEQIRVRVYMVTRLGEKIAEIHGIYFHKGNKALYYDSYIEASDVKKYLMGNQIIINLLLNNASMIRFGIAETVRIESEYVETGDCIFRPTIEVWIDDDSVLAFEVACDMPEKYIKLADKVRRYYLCMERDDYLFANFHADLAYPQLVICGENFEHNKKIVKFLKDCELWREEHPILFTENHLHVNGTLTTIYSIDDADRQQWFGIPKNFER